MSKRLDWAFFRVMMTLLAIASSVPILGITIAASAWSGGIGNVYLVAIGVGFFGMFSGFWSAIPRRLRLKWVTFMSALTIVALSAIYMTEMVRDPAVPLNDTLPVAGNFRLPTLLLLGFPMVCCLIEALLYLPNRKKVMTLL